jgi:hypothetical protein
MKKSLLLTIAGWLVKTFLPKYHIVRKRKKVKK